MIQMEKIQQILIIKNNKKIKETSSSTGDVFCCKKRLKNQSDFLVFSKQS